ncbi:peptidase M3A and M3B thimet/oligopeptidase F [Bacillus sp. FJAT-18017]|uniref:M2 family metallopeptidase n=1 Tax=Bacillus sp. FJAT-18017 TaxID=1705566 RepID=UPI0006B03B52|nr:M2 family metallopeptidase [Bacillus sp. FJAT-18017]ALC90767.1 peptidase M3A and M3B thimet/oligopeptidase F [Bacillus sp. FJAT-18017]
MTTAVNFLKKMNEEMEVLLKSVTEASWMAQTTGDAEWASRLSDASTKFNLFFSDKDTYELAKRLSKQEGLTHEQKREFEAFLTSMAENQLPEDILADLSKRSSELNLRFNTYSPKVNGKEYSANDIREVLINSEDVELRKKVWFASKEVGKVVEKDLIELVKKRNEAARLLGFSNHHEMSFKHQELDRDEVFRIFRELIEQSDPTYRRLKKELDERLAEKFGIQPSDIRPWHYVDPFFQEAPPSKAANLDRFFSGKDLVKLTTDTFNDIGIDITDLYEKSDLYPRTGKNPTAFCTDMDRKGDVRVLCNLTPSSYWMETNLHEFGHAAYFKYTDHDLPFSLRSPAHTLTTEAIAMLFGKMGKDSRWLSKFLQVDSETLAGLAPELEKYQQLQMLISARWIITFVIFEQELYENPDQDLNSLWWKTVEEIQLVTPPDDRSSPDWAAKIHFTLAPVYYQNYLLGELTAAQLQRHVERTISEEFFTNETGKLLVEEFFKPGAMYEWNEKIRRVTGEKLNPQHFVELYC